MHSSILGARAYERDVDNLTVWQDKKDCLDDRKRRSEGEGDREGETHS